jgi:hypothetical protein
MLLGARKADAYAPMCDERGLSISAPPPVMPMGDEKIDTAPQLGCDVSPGLAFRSSARPRVQVVANESPIDACVRVDRHEISRRGSAPFESLEATSLGASPGHDRGVFRPPRG